MRLGTERHIYLRPLLLFYCVHNGRLATGLARRIPLARFWACHACTLAGRLGVDTGGPLVSFDVGGLGVVWVNWV